MFRARRPMTPPEPLLTVLYTVPKIKRISALKRVCHGRSGSSGICPVFLYVVFLGRCGSGPIFYFSRESGELLRHGIVEPCLVGLYMLDIF